MLPKHFPNLPIEKAAHIVVDLETLSTQPNALVLSIGAVALSKFGIPVQSSNFHIVLKQEEQSTRHISQSTVEWWDKQSTEAQQASYKPTEYAYPVGEALWLFSDWVQYIADPKQVLLWGNGCGFDNVILASLFDDWHCERPWSFWNDRDMRTVTGLMPVLKMLPFEGTKHHALHDAKHEAAQLSRAIQKLDEAFRLLTEATAAQQAAA